GGRVHGHWPGLTEADLYDGRDLMPTEDVRSYAAAAMRGMFGLDRATLEDVIFPGLDMGRVGRVLL
ncbi:MAG: twin-arginine translocation pathway signal, partial [Pseudomonadota bacterium]